MSSLDFAALFFMIGIMLLTIATLWQMFVMLSETYTLNRFSGNPKMVWIAMALFFSFSLAVYAVCPNARKKGVVFLLLGASGVICYGLAMYFKHLALQVS